ncbi:MAG: molecular chaperone [Sphingomonas sp.]|uniref:fimbrial biogenesis chaperone n=1 Tax=Sphingomonas sp. TaxID=28214 RepID=UPI001B0BE722|nr:fimbria/pilus periplasmic chaperone [Sphingomonas sp.]MBO9623160.1 molecular chaperone [Sphingomonas sp.]
MRLFLPIAASLLALSGPVAASLLALSGPAFGQSSLRVQPLMVAVAPPSQASAITLQNTSPNPISLQLRAFEWSQAGGADRLKPATDVVVSPPATVIPGGAAYTIRIARTSGPVTTGQKSYRLWIDELPAAGAKRAAGRAVEVRIRYDLPVIFGMPTAASNLSWRARRSGGDVVVEATNNGTGYGRVEGLRLGDVSFGRGLNGYVLPGSTRRWTAPASASQLAANANTALVATVGTSETRVPITIAGN